MRIMFTSLLMFTLSWSCPPPPCPCFDSNHDGCYDTPIPAGEYGVPKPSGDTESGTPNPDVTTEEVVC